MERTPTTTIAPTSIPGKKKASVSTNTIFDKTYVKTVLPGRWNGTHLCDGEGTPTVDTVTHNNDEYTVVVSWRSPEEKPAEWPGLPDREHRDSAYDHYSIAILPRKQSGRDHPEYVYVRTKRNKHGKQLGDSIMRSERYSSLDDAYQAVREELQSKAVYCMQVERWRYYDNPV